MQKSELKNIKREAKSKSMYKFLNIFLDQKELLAQVKSGNAPDINSFLLENNTSQLEEIYNFYKSNVNLLFVNGFQGTGKAEIINYSTAFLSSETIVLKYNCFNSTVLDDILLTFFNEFKKLSTQNVISEPKIKSENFTQKINSYFAQIEKPFVIIIDSFEAILDENRQEILDFIAHLNTLQKIKIIIIGRTFESKYFKDVELERLTIFALEKPIFEKYLKAEKIKAQNAIIGELYNHTHGYYFSTSFSIKLMQNGKISLVDFLVKLKNSYLPFQKFIEKESLTLIPPTERNLFAFLSMIRHPVSVELLKKLNLYDEEKIKFLIDNLIIIEDKSQLYVQDYIKEQADEAISSHVAQKIHQYIIDLYNTQLPLRPSKRDICVSRQTMRKEIEYHQFFLPRRPRNREKAPVDIDYLSYSKIIDFGKEKNEPEAKTENKKSKPQIDLTQRKNISINLENLPYQGEKSKEVAKTNEELIEEENEAESKMSLKELASLIQKAELEYQYTRIIDLCQKSLLHKNDADYQVYLPTIYVKIAHAYNRIADYENSLKYYNLAQELYKSKGKFSKANYVKFNIAKILYETYKLENAKELLLELINDKENPPILKTKVYLQLANLEENLSNPDEAFSYCKKAIETSDEAMDVNTLSELYFKYALAVDDKNDVKTAIEFYNKCINLSDDYKINKFLSPCYSNIAALYLERNDIENAIYNYTKAYKIDEKNNNLEGMYDSATKLASILQRRQPEKAIEFFYTALDCAKMTKDIFYIVSSSLALGDYFYDKQQDEFALKHYLYALDLAHNNLSADNINKINVRISDIKFRMGIEKFENTAESIREQADE